MVNLEQTNQYRVVKLNLWVFFKKGCSLVDDILPPVKYHSKLSHELNYLMEDFHIPRVDGYSNPKKLKSLKSNPIHRIS